MKKKLHIHSDNALWAGCENMPGIFLQDLMLNDTFDITFSYRYSRKYEEGFRKWVDPSVLFSDEEVFGIENVKQSIFPLNLWVSYLYKIRPYFKPIMALKYSLLIEETMKISLILKNIKPDILHVNNGGYFGATSCNSAVMVGQLLSVPNITYMLNSTTTSRWYEQPITALIKRGVRTWVSASEHLKNKSKFLHHNNWEVIPNTIKEKKVIHKDIVKRWLIIPDDKVVFACVGNFEKRKGFKYAIRAFNSMDDGTCRLLLKGSGEEGINLLKETKGNPSIKFVPDNIDTYSLINACDVLVVPSIGNEDFPNVILIAMMYGKPIIASRLAGIPEMVGYTNGCIVEPKDIDFISHCMKKFMDEKVREWFGENSKTIFETEYSNEVILNKWRDLWSR